MVELFRNDLTNEQKAWFAGFIDGEGYLGITFQRKKENRNQSASPCYHSLLKLNKRGP